MASGEKSSEGVLGSVLGVSGIIIAFVNLTGFTPLMQAFLMLLGIALTFLVARFVTRQSIIETFRKLHPFARRIYIATGIVLVLGLAILIRDGYLESPAPMEDALGIYEVNVQGEVSGNPFSSSGQLVARRRIIAAGNNGNDSNPFDTCLRVGWPAGTPATGAIWFFTNRRCASEANDALDLAEVHWDDDSAGYVAFPEPEHAGIFSNTFTAISGVYACIYTPTRGQVRYRFSRGGTVNGSINLVGSGCEEKPGNRGSTYSATLTGQRKKSEH